MAQDALERLMNSSNDQEPRYSVEEQMDSVEDDDFLESMSNDSRSALLKTIQSPIIQEVTMEDNSTTNEVAHEPITEATAEVTTEDTQSDDNTTIYSAPIVESKPKEVLSNYNNEDKKVHKPRGRAVKQANEQIASSITNNTTVFDPIMNQLALNLIADLQTKKFKMNGFDDNLMQIVFDYMRTKFM